MWLRKLTYTYYIKNARCHNFLGVAIWTVETNFLIFKLRLFHLCCFAHPLTWTAPPETVQHVHSPGSHIRWPGTLTTIWFSRTTLETLQTFKSHNLTTCCEQEKLNHRFRLIYFGVLICIQFRIDKKQTTSVLEVLNTGESSQLARRFG